MPKMEKMKTPIFTEDKDTSKLNFYYLIILALTLFIPTFILSTTILENAFERPKTLLLVCGAALLIGLYAIRFLRGKPVPIAGSQTPNLLIFLLLLNGFNLFYTKNYYYTCLAAAMHVSCLIVFYITSTHIDQKKAFWILTATALGGLFVAFDSWLQFFNIFLFYKGHPGMNPVGTIGNSNHLGAYLLFPVFALLGLVFLVKGRLRLLMGFILLFVFSAFLISRARASWLAFAIAFPIFIRLIIKIYGWTSRTKRTLGIVLLAVCILLPLAYFSSPRVRNTFSFNSVFDSDTLHLRVHKYWPSVWHLFIKNPLFGNGFWSYRNMVYEAQTEINERTGDFFKNYPEPKPREAHNDLIEVFSEGGIVLGFTLFFFLVMVLRHGWLIIRNTNLKPETRLITATAFSSVIAIMGACIFFFPLRVNTTMFMAALMMGVMEGMYLLNYDLIQVKSTGKAGTNYILIVFTSLTLIGFTWFGAVKPLLGEKEFLNYQQHRARGEYYLSQKEYQIAQLAFQKARECLTKALDKDPLNTTYNLNAGLFYINTFQDNQKANDYLEKAINHFNGDIVLWSLYDIKGRLKLQLGSPLEAKVAFEKALKFYPEFERAQVGLAIAKKALAERAIQPNSTNNN